MATASAAPRIERDSIGERTLPPEVYYGVQSLRAAENFPITGHRCHTEMIVAIAQIKKAAALTNAGLGLIPADVAGAIEKACDEIAAGQLHDAFIVDPIQGGAGTSFNMNANEVIANRAIELLGGVKGDYKVVSPNDHVNYGQSTNDVYPSAGKLAVLEVLIKAVERLGELKLALEAKADEFDDVLKMGRTQLQDAVPIRLGQEFRAWSHAIGRDIARLTRAQEEVRVLNMGGTAVGTGLNADEEYVRRIVPALSAVTGLELRQSEDLIDGTQNLDCYPAVSGAVKACAVNLSKMCNDLRLLSSGPRCGLGEIELPPMQNGSSIMPGKVNPVIPEVVNQVAFLVMGHDVTVAMAAEAGQMELNAFEPVIFHCLIESIQSLDHAVGTLIEHCIVGIKANRERCQALVEGSVGIITALVPHIGYQNAADLAKRAIKTGASVKELLLQEGIMDGATLEKILEPKGMTTPGIAGRELLK